MSFAENLRRKADIVRRERVIAKYGPEIEQIKKKAYMASDDGKYSTAIQIDIKSDTDYETEVNDINFFLQFELGVSVGTYYSVTVNEKVLTEIKINWMDK